MSSLHKEIWIDAPCELVWDAVRDVGALHTRLVPGFVVDTRLEPGARIVTFGNGMTVREPIISLDETRKRLAWAALGGGATHYNAALEVAPEKHGTRVRWTSDFLPDELEPQLSSMQDQGLTAMRRKLEADAASQRHTR